jgi:asparagine synthase (glutamine-hydrolysing)
MSQIAAAVAWNRAAAPLVTEAELANALWRTAGDRVRTRDVPGGRLGWVACGTARDPRLLVDADARIAVVADCRLDNRDELRRSLAADPEVSDDVLLLRGYQTWDCDLPGRLRGDFTGVIWDWGREIVVGFRDPMGIKPLFFSVAAHGLALSSDVEALHKLAGGGVPDDQLIVEQLTWDYRSTERTFWRDLRRLPGGHTMLATPRTLAVTRYWSPPAHRPPGATQDQIQARFREIFSRSVERCLDPEQPMLAHLSGGVDSSSVVCVADRLYRESPGARPPLRVVSARYPDLACDEGEYIEAVARSISLPCESWDGRDDEFLDLDAPTLAGPGLRTHRSDGSMGEFVIAKRTGARVILTGNGGDHVGAPFGVFEQGVRARPLQFAWETLARRDFPWDRRLRRTRFLLRVLAPDPWRVLVAARRGRRRSPAWLQPRWRELAGDLAASWSHRDGRPFGSAIQETRWRELTGGRMALALEADHRCSSVQGVEMRYPFLDQELVTWVLSLPPDAWPSSEAHWRLQRGALASVLPVEIRERTTKAQFSHIVAYRMRRATSRLRSLFFEGEWASEPWVDRKAAQQLLERSLSGAAPIHWPDWQAIWVIGGLEAWLRSVFRYHSSASGWHFESRRD